MCYDNNSIFVIRLNGVNVIR